eukprot:3683722-Pyramimonas_sp.AAC.1
MAWKTIRISMRTECPKRRETAAPAFRVKAGQVANKGRGLHLINDSILRNGSGRVPRWRNGHSANACM